MYKFVRNKPFGSLLEISPTNHICLNSFNLEFQNIEVWFTDQNRQQLEIEERINSTLVIKQKIYWCIKIDRIYVKKYGFLPFANYIGKNLSNKYGQILLDSAKNSTTDFIKTTSKDKFEKQQKQLAI